MIAHVYLEGCVWSIGGECHPPKAENEVLNLAKESVSFLCSQRFSDIWHERIISHNLRANLVENIARNYVNRGFTLSDLIKEGNLGFSHALNNFELEGGSRFSNYAKRCIRQNIERAIMKLPETVQPLRASKIMSSRTIADAPLTEEALKPPYQCV